MQKINFDQVFVRTSGASLTYGAGIDYFDILMLTERPSPSSSPDGILEKAKRLGARPLIRVKIWGNLGDQLFQYALALHLSRINNCTIDFNDEEF